MIELEEDEDMPLAKFAKISNIVEELPLATLCKINKFSKSHHNPMLQNMESILNEYHDPSYQQPPSLDSSFSSDQQVSMVDQVATDPNLEMSILIENSFSNDEQSMITNINSPPPPPPPPPKVAPDVPVEYEWPERSGEYYLLMGSLAKFLEIQDDEKSLSKLDTRVASDEEREHLVQVGVFEATTKSEEISVARSEDAFQFMCENYRTKFQMYIEGVHRREMKKLVQKQEAQRSEVIKGNISRILKRTLKETVKYNSKLNSERKESRCAYFDLQTQIIHLPQKKRVYDPNSKVEKSSYPLALLPGQFQDYYKVFTSEQLKMFPLNTVTAFPCPKKKPVVVDEEIEKKEKEVEDKNRDEKPIKEAPAALSNDVAPDKDPFCGICMKGPEMNKRGLPEKLISCSQCVNSGHPSCLDMNRHLVTVIKTYPWQCMECKVCTECLAPHDEEEMIFCDNCDRGYHSYCVGLKEIPKGRWVCNRCGKCASCLEVNAVPEGTPGRWKNEHSKPRGEEEQSDFLQIHCHSCSKLFRKGAFCPVCLKVYRSDDDHINPMVCCDECDRWIHTDCDGIDDHRYMELSKDHKSSYTCILCRGEKEERMDSFHKKYR